MILEGIVTTLGPDGTLNVAPMGPIVDGRPASTGSPSGPYGPRRPTGT